MIPTIAGLDLDGVFDRSAIGPVEGEILPVESPVPAAVVTSATTGRLLTGHDAAAAIEGRGLDPGEPSGLRTGMLDPWQALICEQGTAPNRATWRRLAAHWRWLAGPAQRIVLAIPDSLDERGQDRLLEIARSEQLEPTLLWRPVAALLGAAARRGDRRWHGRRALVLHLGTAGAQAAALDLEQNEGRLTPIRARRGVTARWWDVRDLVRDVARTIQARVGLGDDGWQERLLLTPLPWSVLSGHATDTAPVRGTDGAWRLAPPIGRLPAEDALDIADWLERLIEGLGRSSGQPDLVLVEGALLRAGFDDGTSLERLIRSTIARSLRLPADRIELLEPDAVARGCVEHARRQARMQVSYYDFLPQIEINAVRERKVDFVPLVRGQDRIADNQPYEGEVQGFWVPAHAERLVFTLIHGNDRHVRSLVVALPAPLEREVGAWLRVQQRPASGSARVEIVTEPPGALGTGRLLLDWQRLEQTAETREQARLRLQGEVGYAYPDCSPIQAHAFWWRHRDLERLFRRFAAEPLPPQRPPSLQRHRARAKALVADLRANRLPTDVIPGDGARYGVVDAAGAPPAALGPSAHAAYEAMLTALAQDFAAIRAWARDPEVLYLERQLYLAGAWCYAGCPEPLLRHLRDGLRLGQSVGYMIEAMGRAFAQDQDIRLFFDKMAKVCLPGIVPSMHWIKSCAMLLAFRTNAAELLDERTAPRFARAAAAMLEQEIRNENVQQKFFNAAYLLLGILRYRTQRPRFLLGGADDPTQPALKSWIVEILAQAHRLSKGRHQKMIEDVKEYLEGHGTNQLIFKDIEEISDSSK